MAAIVDGDPPDIVLNREIVEVYGLDDSHLWALIARERPELERRKLVYRSGRRSPSTADKTLVLVDDGAATGTTMKVAIRALKRLWRPTRAHTACASWGITTTLSAACASTTVEPPMVE